MSLALHTAAAQSNAPPLRPIRLVQTLGESERDGDAYALSKIQSVQVAPSGDVFVLDRAEADIKMFNAAGKYVRTFARRGTGPGELTGPMFRTRIVDSAFVVTDNMLRRDVFFSFGGRHLRTVSHPPASEAVISPASFSLASGGRLDVTSPSVSNFAPQVYVDLVLRRADGRTVDTLAHFRSEVVTFSRPGPRGMVLRSIAPSDAGQSGAWALAGDSLLAIVDGYGGTIRWLNVRTAAPTVLRTERLAGISTPTSLREFAPVKADLEKAYQRIEPKTTITLLDVPPRHSLASNAFFDDAGALWIAPPATGRGTTWTVYPARAAAFTVQMPPANTLTTVRGRRMYAIGITADDAPVVRVYELGL